MGWQRLGGIVFGTALLEEVIFRSGLMSSAVRSQSRIVMALVPGVAFGWWHLIDAIDDVQEHRDWSALRGAGLIVATVAGMTLASWLILEPVRRRSGSILGPWLIHAAVNSAMVVLGASVK